MPAYRLYFMNPHCAIKRTCEFEADDDSSAIEVAEKWRSEGPMEMWCDARKLRAWPPIHAQLSPAET